MVSVIIGSWGSYNECNERALGSKWLDLSNFDDWSEIEEELAKQGFELDGLDEELFIQDIEGLPTDSKNWDYTNPCELFETLYEAEVLNDSYKYDVMCAYLEICSFDEFETLVRDRGHRWNWDITIWKNKDWYDLAYDFLHEFYEVPDFLENYIDYERYGNELKYDGFHEYSEGIIEIR